MVPDSEVDVPCHAHAAGGGAATAVKANGEVCLSGG